MWSYTYTLDFLEYFIPNWTEITCEYVFVICRLLLDVDELIRTAKITLLLTIVLRIILAKNVYLYM